MLTYSSNNLLSFSSKWKCGLLLIIVSVFLLGCKPSKDIQVTEKPLPPKSIVYMKKQYDELKDKLQYAEVVLIDDTIKVIFPRNVMFSTGSSIINKELYPKFEAFADILNDYFLTRVLITGHTDNTGIYEENITLSENRALAAKNLLQSYDVSPARLFDWGFGDSKPMATNETEEGRALNRRIEFILLYNVEPKTNSP